MSLAPKIFDDFLESIFEATLGKASDHSKSLDVFRIGRQRYKDSIKQKCGEIQILGMTEPVSLESIYVSLKVNRNITSKRYLSEEILRDCDEEDIPDILSVGREDHSLTPDEAIRSYQRLMILGAPGCGKSTLLKYWSLLYTGSISQSEMLEYFYIPFFVPLREVEGDFNLEEILKSTLENARFPNPELFLSRILNDGNALILIDGLDEVSQDRVFQVRHEVEKFYTRFTKNKIIVTCRTASYFDNFEGFAEVEIEPFDEIEICHFVDDWYQDDKKKKDELKKSILGNRGLLELSKSPLMLSLICILHRRELRLPKNRVELYERAVDTMLREWDTSRNFVRETKYDELSGAKKVKLLNFIANDFFASNQKVFSNREVTERVARYIPNFAMSEEEASAVVEEIASQHGLIQMVSSDLMSFSHLTIQEYFTARYIVDTRQEIDVLTNVGDPRWIEVFNCIASLLEDSTNFLVTLLGRGGEDSFFRLCLAAYCISGQTAVSPKMRERVIGDLILEIENASACIKRIYQTQSKKDLTTGLFVESNGNLTENGLVYQDSTRFFAAVNCLVYYFDSVFMADLVNEMENYSIGGNSEKIIRYIERCKDRKEPVIVYSKYFKDGHIVLPLEASMFERRISPLVKRRHSVIKHKRSGRRGSVTKKIG